MGTLQLGLFDAIVTQQEVTELMEAISAVAPGTKVVFSGLVPWPIDHHRSRIRCENFYRALQVSTQQITQKFGYNCEALDVTMEFLNQDYSIRDPITYFEEDLYLSTQGIRVLRVAWLRHLEFFPKKGQFADS